MNNLIKIGLGLSLAIVYVFMIGFGIEAFYPPPQHAHEVCRPLDSVSKLQPSQEDPALPIFDPQSDPEYKRCYDEAQDKVDIYNRDLFLITTAFGFIAMAIGSLLFSEKLGPVGPGLVFGGLFTIFYGNLRSYRSLDKPILFIELVVVFTGIILITWRYLKTSKPKPS